MLSRTANCLFWLARYVERADNVGRALLVSQRMASMGRSLGDAAASQPMLRIAAVR